MKRYIGLTDDPTRRRIDHGEPAGWAVIASFDDEDEARAWKSKMLEIPGYQGDADETGWRYGYSFTPAGSDEPPAR